MYNLKTDSEANNLNLATVYDIYQEPKLSDISFFLLKKSFYKRTE